MKLSFRLTPSLWLRPLALVAVLTGVGSAEAVGTRQFVLDSSSDFEGGDLQGVAIDSTGKLRAGLNLGTVDVEGADTAWAALRRQDGSLLLATGNEGKIVSVRGAVAQVVAESKALVLTSLAEGWGRVFVGSLPDGVIYELKGDKLEKFVTLPQTEHVWALAFDPQQQALLAATGPDGKLFRVTQAGQAQVYFDAEQEHLMSVLAANGKVYAGASDTAVLYEIAGPGRASVLYDFGRTEVRGIVAGEEGSIYAIANELSGGGRGGKLDAEKPPGPGKSTTKKGKGTLYRFSAEGEPEQLLDNKDDHFVSLAMGENGQPYVGSGGEGRVYTVDQNHASLLVADIDERQVAALMVGQTTGFIVGSDPVVVHPIRGVGGTDAVFTSKVYDAGIRAQWGRMSWDADGTLEIQTRTGNTKEPDDGWSDWSASVTAAAPVTSPPGRFLQVRARWSRDRNAILREVTIPFVTDNLRAIVTEVEADTGSQLKGTTGIAKSGGPIEGEPKPKVSLKWKVDNPDEDELRYRVDYRLVGTEDWFDALEPGEVLTSDNYTWDISDLPEGRYRVRVRASDELANPPDRVKRHSLISGVVLVDNSAPTVEGLRVEGRVVRGVALDGIGPIQRIEVSVAGSREWVPFFPVDGIFDEQREEFLIDLSALSPRGPALLSLRVFDAAKNAVVKPIRLQ